MPKICKHDCSFRIEGKMRSASTEIYYSSKEYLFYAPIPAEFNEPFDMLTKEETDKYSVYKQYNRKYGSDGAHKKVVYGSTENECKSNFNTVVKYLAEKIIVKRNIIILYYSGDSSNSWGSEKYNKEHPCLAMRLAIAYGEESRMGDGIPSYAVVTHHEGLDRKTYDVVSNNRYFPFSVLDDTPENRAFVEDLYERFKLLREKLNKLTSTQESLLAFIDSKQKLLN